MKIIVVSDVDFDDSKLRLNQAGISYDTDEYVWDLAFEEFLRDKYPNLDEDDVLAITNNLSNNSYLYEQIDHIISLEYDSYKSEVE